MPPFNAELNSEANDNNETDFGRSLNTIEEETKYIAGIEKADAKEIHNFAQKMEAARQEKRDAEFRDEEYY
jgi:hypothetical protein